MAIIREERIGGQRLILGDCREIIEGLEYDAICADPPYGMDFVSNRRNIKHRQIANDTTPELLQWACSLHAQHSKYIWMRWDNLRDVPMPRSLITWVKNNHTMGDLDHEHGRKTEVCAFYKGDNHYWPGLRPVDVLTCARTTNEHHPTEKPVDLMCSVLRWTAGIVLDCFMGSGTTLVAAEKTGRSAVGVEIDPQHFETACRRVDEATRQPDMFVEPPKPTPLQEGFL